MKRTSASQPATRVATVAGAVVMLGLGLVLSACNTTAGAGQDVSAAGGAVTNAADKVKSGL